MVTQPKLTKLNIINNSSNALRCCLRIVQKDSAILLIEDAVTAAISHSNSGELLKSYLTDHKVFILEPDLKARGIKKERLIDGITLVDYDGFVKLTVASDGVQSWT